MIGFKPAKGRWVVLFVACVVSFVIGLGLVGLLATPWGLDVAVWLAELEDPTVDAPDNWARGMYLLINASIFLAIFGAAGMLVVAGKWTGFDEDWLFDKIIRLGKRKGLFVLFFVAIGVDKWIMTYATERHWAKLVEIVEEKRSQHQAGGDV